MVQFDDSITTLRKTLPGTRIDFEIDEAERRMYVSADDYLRAFERFNMLENHGYISCRSELDNGDDGQYVFEIQSVE